jgi:hypothetical protein
MFAKHVLAVLTAGLASAGPAVAAPAVETMVVGRSGTLIAAQTVTAAATNVSAAGRQCALAAATPLAALVAVTAPRRVALGLHDYGHCDARAADSGQLFVNSIDGQSNSGQNGWEYKVGRVAGTTGAADTSGALGNGRLLASGQQLLWFWCRSTDGGCQRTLGIKVSYPSGRLQAGGALTVSVSGYDNEGRGRPVAAASISFGATSAPTGRSGRATLAVPTRPGRYTLSASKPGLVPSFPATITVP